jgi:hypothetical protein
MPRVSRSSIGRLRPGFRRSRKHFGKAL